MCLLIKNPVHGAIPYIVPYSLQTHYTLSLNELFGIRNKDIRSVSIISDVINICSVLLYICGAGVRGQAPVDYEAVYGGQHLVSTRNKGGVISL